MPIDVTKQFNFGATVINAWKNEVSGKHYIKAIATDTEEDSHGERISENGINGIARCINNKSPHNVGLLPNHWDAFEIGTCETAAVVDSPDIHGAKALEVEIELNMDYPESRSLYMECNEKKSKKQLSIGGYLNPENENPYYWEPKVFVDSGGNVVQDWTLVLDDVILEHIAVTRQNKAANNRTGFVGTIAKSLGIEKPEIPKNNAKGGLVMAKNQENKKFWEVKNVAEKKGELLIYGDIVNYRWYEEDVSANSLIKDLKALGDITQLDIRINSGGGSVFAAAAIVSYLKSHKAYKNVYIDGLAASAASVIAMAGDTIYMPSHAMMMIHNPSTIAWGDSREMRKTADVLDKIRDSIVNAYQVKSKKDSQTIVDFMDAETWWTGKEAVEQGFADVVLDNVEITAYYKNDILNVNGINFDTSKFINKSRMEDTINKVVSVEILKNKDAKEGIIHMSNGNKKQADGLKAVLTNAINAFFGEKAEDNDQKIEDARKVVENAKKLVGSLNAAELPDDLKEFVDKLNAAAVTEPTAEVEGEDKTGEEVVEEKPADDKAEKPAEAVVEETPADDKAEKPAEAPKDTVDAEALKNAIVADIKASLGADNKKAFEEIAKSLGAVIGDVIKTQVQPLNEKIASIEKAAGVSKSIEGQEKPKVTNKSAVTAETDKESGDLWTGIITNALPKEFYNKKYNETEE